MELIEPGIGSGLCWLFQNLTSCPPPPLQTPPPPLYSLGGVPPLPPDPPLTGQLHTSRTAKAMKAM